MVSNFANGWFYQYLRLIFIKNPSYCSWLLHFSGIALPCWTKLQLMVNKRWYWPILADNGRHQSTIVYLCLVGGFQDSLSSNIYQANSGWLGLKKAGAFGIKISSHAVALGDRFSTGYSKTRFCCGVSLQDWNCPGVLGVAFVLNAFI